MHQEEIRSLRALLAPPDRYAAETPWGPFGALIIVAIAVAAQFGAAVVAAALVGAWQGTPLSNQAFHELFGLTRLSGVGFLIGSQLLAAGLIWLAAGRKGQRAAVLRWLPPVPDWTTAALAGGLLVLLMTPGELLLYRLTGADLFADTRWLVEGLRGPTWPAVVFAVVVLAPLWEEMAFRGFLLSAFAKTWLGFWPSAILVDLFWTALHAGYSTVGMIDVFLAGLALAWLLRRTGSLRATIVAHGIANASSIAFALAFAPA